MDVKCSSCDKLIGRFFMEKATKVFCSSTCEDKFPYPFPIADESSAEGVKRELQVKPAKPTCDPLVMTFMMSSFNGRNYRKKDDTSADDDL